MLNLPRQGKLANSDINQLKALSESEDIIELSCQNNSRLKGLRYLCSNDTQSLN